MYSISFLCTWRIFFLFLKRFYFRDTRIISILFNRKFSIVRIITIWNKQVLKCRRTIFVRYVLQIVYNSCDRRSWVRELFSPNMYRSCVSRIKRTTRITDVGHGLPMTAGSGGELKRAATAGLQRSKYELNTMTRGKCEIHASRRSRVNTHPLINCSSRYSRGNARPA